MNWPMSPLEMSATPSCSLTAASSFSASAVHSSPESVPAPVALVTNSRCSEPPGLTGSKVTIAIPSLPAAWSSGRIVSELPARLKAVPPAARVS